MLGLPALMVMSLSGVIVGGEPSFNDFSAATVSGFFFSVITARAPRDSGACFSSEVLSAVNSLALAALTVVPKIYETALFQCVVLNNFDRKFGSFFYYDPSCVSKHIAVMINNNKFTLVL